MDVGKRKRRDCENDRSLKKIRLDLDGLRRAFIHNFKAMADDLSVKEILPELLSRVLVTHKEADEVDSENTKARKNFRLLCIIHRKANADKQRLVTFLEALESVNSMDPGCRLEHIIEGIRSDHSTPSTTGAVDSNYLHEMLQMNYRLIQCSVDAQHFLPELISREVITVEQSQQVFSETTSEARSTCLLNLMESSNDLCSTAFEVLESTETLKLYRPSELPQQLHSSETHPETVAFKRAMGKLGASLTEEDVNNLLPSLYACDIISKPFRDELSSLASHYTVLVKRNKLLFHLENKIRNNPSVFTKLIEICSEEHLQKPEEILRKFYKESLPLSPHTVERDSKLASGVLNPHVSKFSQQLQELYTHNGSHKIICSQKWPYINSDGFYINLAIIKRRERVTFATADPFTRETIERNEDIDIVLMSKEKIEMDDVLKIEPGGNIDRLQIILVQGAPGVGKSTFALEMAKRCKEVTSFSLVLLVQLRQPTAHNASTLDDLLRLYVCHDSTKHVSDYFIEQQGEGLLLILDGFDELPSNVTSDDNSSIYIRLLQGEYLPKATIILTTRPSVINCIQRVCDTRVSKYIEIVGFLSPQIDEFAHNCLGIEKAEDFLQYIYSYPHIKSMMYIPLNTAIMVKLYCSIAEYTHKQLPMTLTQLYTEFCLHLLQCCVDSRYSESQFKQQFSDQQQGFHSELECMPEEIQSQVKEIAKVAFEGIATHTVVFHNLSPDFDHMDLMTKCERLVPSRCKSYRSAASFNFLHLTVQEFLAAFHISCLPASSQKELLQLHHPEQHFSRVWRFLAGLTSFKQIEWEFFMGIMTTTKCGSDMQIFNSLLANCLYEAQDPSICSRAYSEGCTVYSPMSVTHYDYYSLGYCIANSPCSWKLCTIGGDGLAIVASGIKSIKSAPKGKIELIKLSYNGERIGDIYELPACMRKDITELNLGNCGFNKTACDSLANIIKLFPNVNRLDLADNPFTEGDATNLLKSVSRLSNMNYLDLLHAKLSSEDVDALCDLITTKGPLKNLIVGSTTMLPSVVEKMLNVILVDSQLRNLSIMNLDLAEFGSQLGKALKQNKTLDTLMLWDRSFCIEGCIEIVRALDENRSLKSLTLMPWYKFHIPESLFKDNIRINWFYYPKQK